MERLLVGLGNPGREYEGTRHNVGFEVLEHLARSEGLFFRAPRSLAGYTGPGTFQVASLESAAALLIKPETFMNRSGDVVAPVLRWSGIEPGELLVVYDDIDLPLGSLRIRPFGGAGGHRGMRSIIDSLSTDRFPRLRVGIGRTATDAARHVLSKFDRKEREEIDVSVAEAAEAVLFWLRSGDIEGCMTRFHSRWNQGSAS